MLLHEVMDIAIRNLDAPGCRYELVAWAKRKYMHYKAQDCCWAVCTKKSGLNALGHKIATSRDALSNDRHESATRFERPAN